MANKRASKRLKTTSQGAAPDDAATPTPADNTLTGMPLDILRRILETMSPAELLAMHDVNKGFRRMLVKSGKKENPIWVNSREHHGIPKPFEGFDELAWARFIFGRICEECEKNESDAPDFGLMMRLCTNCRETNLCQELDFSEESDEEDEMGPILEFEDSFPHSNWYSSREEIFEEGYNHGWGGWADLGRNQHWWAPYLYDILPLVRGAKRGDRGAQKKLDKLFEEGERRLKHGELCDEWRDGVEEEENRAKQESLKNKFKALGYQDPDLGGLDSHKVLVQFKHPLTEDAWAGMRESLEGPIQNKRRIRLLNKHPEMMQARRSLAREAYLAYAATVLPREATFLPTLAGLDAIPEIRSICEREPDVDVTIADFSALPSIIEAWVTAKRVRLTQLANGATPEKTSDRFNLASTIFRCHNGHNVGQEKLGRPAMFGGDEAMRHVEETCDPQLDHALSEVASALVASLGLDPNTASVADMDHRNARFRCDGRVAYDVCGKYNKDIKVFTWRGCITHAIETHHYGSQEKTPSYRKPDADYYHKDGTVSFVAIPAHPGAESRGPFSDDLPRADSTSWVCGHCTKFVCAPQTFQAVNDHVKTEHGEPHPGTSDVLLGPGVLPVSKSCYSIGRPGSTAGAQPTPNPPPRAPGVAFLCLRCLKKRKLFRTSGAVCDHLRAVHKIRNAVLDLDYGTSTS
ncbi:hypothetical protein B0H14DRAFT_3897201 [Mycena olivaceomarginata]|nr:hypothetical protein B0H14DRAFT_3897201 [Mycena olivaceomarginata]